MNLQEKVGQYAKAKGTTKNAIADELGISRSSFFNKLRGSYEFSFGEAYRLSRILGVSLDDIYLLMQPESKQ
jgi:DNA-binding XRE family transcriptional regulator